MEWLKTLGVGLQIQMTKQWEEHGETSEEVE